MTYQVVLSRSAKRALTVDLPERVAAAVAEFIAGPLAENPHRVGHRLRAEWAGYYSARRGSYRVIYAIHEDTVLVEVVKIAHRGQAYA